MPQDPLAVLPYYGGTVTLTGTRQSIAALLASIYAAIPGSVPPPPNLGVAELHLKADTGNSTSLCLIGDINLTTANYSDQLSSNAADRGLVYGPYMMSAIPLADIYAMASGGSPKMSIAVIVV